MLDAESNVRVLIEGAFPRRFFIRCFKRNRLIAFCLRHLHAAVPHAMLHVAAPKENQAGFSSAFSVTKDILPPAVDTLLCSFRADFLCKPLILRGCADFVWYIIENYVLYF
jgi:hypothetical protein